jgi:membrane protease YdiL (CAAX protease family)
MIVIVPAQVPANPFAVLWPALLLAVGAATAAGIGVFRRGSIAGPDRMDKDDGLDSLTFIMGIGMSAYFFTALMALRILGGPKAAASSSELSSTDIVGDLLARAAAVTVILAMIFAIHRPRRLGLSLRKFFPGVGKGLLGILIVMPLMFVVLIIVTRLMGPQSQYIHPYLKQLGQADGGKQRALILFSILVAAPFSEEIFFRGCLQTFFSGLFSRRSRWLAVVLTSLFFAMAHGDWWARPPIFVLSLCLGYAYERTGNLWTSITIHAAFNAVQAAIFFEFVGSS